MEQLVIEGGRRLEGAVTIAGSKNSALPILAATLLAEGECVLRNVPRLSDIDLMLDILHELGVESTRRPDGAVVTRAGGGGSRAAPYDLVSRIRASICTLGPLLARHGEARVSLPGGCVIGVRPVDLHLKGVRALGAEVEVEHGDIVARAPRGLAGAEVYLGGEFGSSVTGTANVLMAATMARGVTVIESAACEPEVTDLVRFLKAMGARIDGEGTPTLTIQGVERLTGCEHAVIPDRVEAGTFMFAAAITGGDVALHGADLSHLRGVVDVLTRAGMRVTQPQQDVVRVRGCRVPASVNVTTNVHPGFPTDLQAPLMALLAITPGISLITERVYPDRFMHVAELNRMGANVRKQGATAIVEGVEYLSGAPVAASDLRAAAALVIAGLVARGRTEVNRLEHLDRGYDRFEEKLRALGADVTRHQVPLPRRRQSDQTPPSPPAAAAA
ncbi:MAG: UDP-N-acetylglucosamine 1-carboxyvinyltransferase [Planctomycetes bacterium]|nr:UDP-N-acetylglucosamine 1-carboxyvinyltransferase [Planctomycetota bacterium]